MKKAFGQFLFLLYTLVFVVCNTGYSNVADYFSNQNKIFSLGVNDALIDTFSEYHLITDAQIEAQKQLFADLTDVSEEEGDEHVFSSQQKFNFGGFSAAFLNVQLLSYVSFRLQRNIRSVKANCIVTYFKRYHRFQVYRI